MTLRAWQEEALCRVDRWIYDQGKPAVISAVMGSGKSRVISEICQSYPDKSIVISTPTVALVEQLSEQIEEAGMWYTHAKAHRRVTVVCNPSLEDLASTHPGPDLWIADEVHRTESKQILKAQKLLNPAQSLGFTATPFLSDTKRSLSLWQGCLLTYSATDAVRDKVVVPWFIDTGSFGEHTFIDDACTQMISSSEGPGIVNAISIQDATDYSSQLCQAGIPSSPIDSSMPRSQRRQILEDLRLGKLRVVVHVALLTEGVDLPWLRWICLRRDVSSRVRFVQEVGRVLRAYPGKEVATIYDPRGITGELRLDYLSCLGGISVDAIEKPRSTKVSDLPAMVVDGWISPTHPISRYLRMVATYLESVGHISKPLTCGPWRKMPSTARQHEVIENMKFFNSLSGAPDHHKRAIRKAMSVCREQDRGFCSDLVSVLMAQADHQHGWPDGCPLEVEE